LERLKKRVAAKGYEFFELSAATGAGTKALAKKAAELLSTLPPVTVYEADYVPPEPKPDTPEDLTIERYDDLWILEGAWLDRLTDSVNFSDYESRMFFERVLRGSGVYARMEAEGITDGDTVSINGMEFEYRR